MATALFIPKYCPSMYQKGYKKEPCRGMYFNENFFGLLLWDIKLFHIYQTVRKAPLIPHALFCQFSKLFGTFNITLHMLYV